MPSARHHMTPRELVDDARFWISPFIKRCNRQKGYASLGELARRYGIVKSYAIEPFHSMDNLAMLCVEGTTYKRNNKLKGR